nr:hypothetical protein [Tanacetum cinerariifolium]
MQIDELHKFSDGTLIDVRTALDDRLKGIRMQYLPQSIWRKSDKDRAAAMIQAIDKRLKTRRIMRSLERIVRGSDEVLKLKNFKKDAILELFKLLNQERYEHVGLKVTSAQGGKDYKMAKRDYAWLTISRCSRLHPIQAKEQAQDLKSMITTPNSQVND